jgi:hypothetical protein
MALFTIASLRRQQASWRVPTNAAMQKQLHTGHWSLFQPPGFRGFDGINAQRRAESGHSRPENPSSMTEQAHNSTEHRWNFG